MSNNRNLNDDNFDTSPSGKEGEMEVRLWEYIDGLTTDPGTIERLIAENAAWREKYAELLDVHELVQATTLEEPSLRFTKNVMEEISRLQITPAAKKYIDTKIIWGIVAFFLTVIIGFLGYGLSQATWSEGSRAGSSIGLDLGTIDYSRFFNNSFVNLFMMLNVILGLMLLDRFLAMKRKKLREM